MKRVFALAAVLLALATCASPALAQTIMYPGWSAPISGNVLFSPDNTYTIGLNGASRPAGIFLGSSGVLTSGNVVTSIGQFFQWSGGSRLAGPADGQLKCVNAAQTAVCSVIGTATNDNALATAIGEYICAQVSNGGTPAGCATNTSTPVSLTNGSNSDIVSVSLTAGDWKVCATLAFFPAGTTTVSTLQGWTSTASATLPAFPNGGAYSQLNAAFTTGAVAYMPVSCARYSLASTTSVFLTVRPGFATSTMTGGGFLEAWRVR